MATMYSYSAYGLHIHSPLPLPEFVASEGEADVIIRYGKIEFPWAETNGAHRRICGTAEGIYFFWTDIGCFFVQNGNEIVIDPVPESEERDIRLAIVGPVFGALLHQRGLALFHSSAVALPSGAVAFLAHKGYGKSTMAAALHARGHNLITDDILALEEKEDHFMIRPGFPQLKLWPESIEAVGRNPEALPMLRANLEKRACRVSHGFSSQQLPLRCVFLLTGGPDLEITPLSPKEAWPQVMPHWYGAVFQELLRIFGLENQLRDCVNLVQRVPIYVLRRPRSLADLPDVAQLVEEHFSHNLQPVKA